MAGFRNLLVACTLMVLALMAQPVRAESLYVKGEGGVPLAVTVTGPKDAPAILFLHGIGLGAGSFKPQLESDLVKHFRMVVFDLRGHGQSGKPWEVSAYADSSIWAGDVKRVIDATGIKRPVIVAWSYGTLVAADYLRHFGPDAISGLVLASATGGLIVTPPSPTPPNPVIMAQLTRSRELRNIPTLSAQQEAGAIVLPLLVHKAPLAGWLDDARILEGEVPAYAQAPLRAHPSANTDIVSRLQSLPILLTYGQFDGAMSDAAADAMRQALPQTKVFRFDGAGHAMFAEKPKTFNRMLKEFVDQVWKETK
ncbi:alpha/beta fold hydrolase [Sphingomonas sp. 28-63-12]|uniref:alpha/beta fold hydrolase n=1 Tax=Sphingomonas sp. 28-63-12 TaxID=1970434 RepID=UPI000BC36A2E|nr:MAG: hypothetical protein B7Y47_02160 [Sphingomonas sp. 28-63-12]